MSVINQVLVELEKRRASGAERGTLPDHVRALPDGDGNEDGIAWRFAVGGAAVIVLVGMIWLAVERYGFPRLSSKGTPPPAVAEAVIEKVVLASAASVVDGTSDVAAGGAQSQAWAPVSRLSFELARAPAAQPVAEPAPEAAAPRGAVPATRVLARAGNERSSPAAGDTPAVPPTPAVAEDSSGAPPAGQATPQRPAAKAAAVPAAKGEIEKQVRQPTARELVDQEYRKAATLLQQGRLAEAQDGFRATLNLQAGHHGARQALVALLLQAKVHGEAERLLQEGMRLAPEQTGFSMTLARLQVDHGDIAAAIATLQGGVGHAQGNPDYLAFLAALLQRQGRHDEAIQQFSAALRSKPGTGVWWLGLAMSLQAVNRTADAQDAYRRAKASNLNAELAAFADQRLRQLQ